MDVRVWRKSSEQHGQWRRKIPCHSSRIFLECFLMAYTFRRNLDKEMSIRSAVDHAIDLGSKRISLSPRQYRTLFSLNPRQYKTLLKSRCVVAKPVKNWRYRNTIITVWGTRRMR